MFVLPIATWLQAQTASLESKQSGKRKLMFGPARREERRRIIGFYRIPGCRDTYVDAVGGLANPATYPSCATTAGHLAERHAREKNADHPVFDSQSRRRMHPFDFSALSFERHGYLAKETVGFTKKLAFCRAVALGLEPSAEIRRWYGVISCCIQRANAKILRGEPVPGSFSSRPPRLVARGQDLALVGA